MNINLYKKYFSGTILFENSHIQEIDLIYISTPDLQTIVKSFNSIHIEKFTGKYTLKYVPAGDYRMNIFFTTYPYAKEIASPVFKVTSGETLHIRYGGAGEWSIFNN